jgi:hypothetical protein
VPQWPQGLRAAEGRSWECEGTNEENTADTIPILGQLRESIFGRSRFSDGIPYIDSQRPTSHYILGFVFRSQYINATLTHSHFPSRQVFLGRSQNVKHGLPRRAENHRRCRVVQTATWLGLYFCGRMRCSFQVSTYVAISERRSFMGMHLTGGDCAESWYQ